MLLLTGASGYLGRALSQVLAARNFDVITAGRHHDSVSLLPWRELDLAKAGHARSALAGVEQVIHCAGIAHNNGALADYDRVNVKGTLMLAEAALCHGVGRFVLVSSLNVVPAESDSAELPVDNYPLPKNAYAASKWRAEHQLKALLAGSECELIIVRPALIYDRVLVANLALLRKIARRLPLAFPNVGARSMVARPDLVALLVAIAASPLPRHQASSAPLHVAAVDGQCYSARTISRVLAGADAWQIPLPSWCWRTFADVWDRYQNLPSGQTWSSLSENHWCAAARGQPHPGVARYMWQPQHTFESLMVESPE